MVESFLDKEEYAVYNTIKEYLRENHFFKIKEITSFLRFNLDKSLKLDTPKIRRILNSLIRKGLIVPGSKLTWDDILKNSTRKQMFEFIETNPSVHLYDIMKSLDIGTHQALWHIGILKKFLFIRSIHVENHEIFFKYNLDSSYDKIFYYLRNNKVKKIINLMEINEQGLQTTEISADLKMHYDTTRKYLKVLEDLNFITINNIGGKTLNKLERENYYDTLEFIKDLK